MGSMGIVGLGEEYRRTEWSHLLLWLLFHVVGVSKLHEYDLPSGYSWEYNALVPEARSGASESEYFSCDSSFSNPSCSGKDKGRTVKA